MKKDLEEVLVIPRVLAAKLLMTSRLLIMVWLMECQYSK